jgi:DNA replication protein DnaC
MSPRPESQPSVRQASSRSSARSCGCRRLPARAGPWLSKPNVSASRIWGYLEALLAAELEDRERRAIERRIKEAHLPRVKTLDEFDFRQAPTSRRRS